MANKKRLIDANEVKKQIWYGNSDPSNMRQYASGFIDNAPTVDAVEVVRCKDCENTCHGSYGLVCIIWGAGTEPDAFCSYGERKDNG